jgi:UDP-N-acetylmuramoyl-tripeptide--D-alanyl-D-alanine ligase
MQLTQKDLLQVRHVRTFHLEQLKTIRSISTDSRTVRAGDLFVALRGEQFDGHDFIEQVVDARAGALIVEDAWFELKGRWLTTRTLPVLVVNNTTFALGEVARIHRRKFRIPVIAVGGSNGKTTTKEMIANVLGSRFSVLSTAGNLNNHVGVPQTLFRLKQKHHVAVVEIGTNHFGEVNYLCTILEPTHGLITNIGREHLEFFGKLSGVARAEGELFLWLAAHGNRYARGIVNADDPWVVKQAIRLKRKFSYGFQNKNVDVRGRVLRYDRQMCAELEVTPKGKKSFVVKLNVPGEHHAANALAAAAVGLLFKVPPAKIQKALESFRAVSKRMQLLRLRGVTVLDDAYNANPDSVLAALRTLGALETRGKRIAVLADMLELGASAEEAHRAVGRAAGTAGVEYLLTYGSLARYIHEAASVKFKSHFDQKNMLAEYLLELLSAGDVVLIKGSRGMKMEDVVTFLQERLRRAA